MNASKSLRAIPVHWLSFALAVTVTLSMYTWYGVNIARWRNSPDFGWRTMYDSGPNAVAEVFDAGKMAGLRAGDTIEAINGRPYSTFEELFFGSIRGADPGSVNRYTVIRDGKRIDIEIPTGRLGFRAVLRRSGPLFLMGLLYVFIGALVFLMKPRATESQLFLLMTCFVGMRVSFAAPSELIRPTWFYDLRFLNETLLPASMISLAATFPKTHPLIRNRPALAFIPYLPSFALFLLLELTTTAYWNIPRSLFLAAQVYTLLGIVFFLSSMARNVLSDTSLIVRLQSQVIFAGILLAFLIPTTDLLSRFLWRFYLFPDPALSFAAFLSLFPLSIGYTIVKHDLFAIDVIVRRTYGYVLSTASIVGTYGLLVTVLNVTFQGSEFAKSPLFSIGFALGVVFLFEPLHRRIQRVVDRVFYRQQYDYRKTIKSVSEAMTSIFEQDVIAGRLVGSVVREMFLESGALFLRSSSGGAYHVKVVEGADAGKLGLREIDPGDPLLRALKEKNDVLLRHDFALNPIYEAERSVLEDRMQALSSELLIPMRYKDELVGVVSLGRKKSGKMFRPEDLDLLRTLTNQSAIALENAKLFKENLEKGRMEEELRIAHDIQLSMLPDAPPAIEGLQIAARSIPAREVGGDFYDFVELDGESGRRVGIVVGDVSGKGVSGALLMAASRSTYRVLTEIHASVAEVMSLANQRLQRDIKKGTFVALLYAVIDPRAKALTLSNAGQTQPIICRSGEAAPFYVRTEGDTFPLGIVTDCDYQEAVVPLKEGDIVVFYTDGVVEAMDGQGQLYGFDRLAASIDEGRHLDAARLLEKLMNDVSRYVGDVEQHDDITMVVARLD